MKNEYGEVEVVGPGLLTQNFKLIRQEGRKDYLVFAKTMKYRADDKEHPLDVKESNN